MEKKYAIFTALIITLIIAGNYLFFYDFDSGREIVVVGRVMDGDTVELDDGRKIRLLNINTPEKGRAFSDEAFDFLKTLEGNSVELDAEGVDRYGRTLGRIYSDKYINLEIVRLGLAHKYLVDEKELGDFIKAEEEAIGNGWGIWQRSEFYGCLNVEINKYEEYVLIKDNCGLNFGGWNLKDESTKIYKMDNVREKEFKIYSAKKDDKDGEYYWGRGEAWNDDKDSIFITDANGLIVYYDSYGY